MSADRAVMQHALRVMEWISKYIGRDDLPGNPNLIVMDMQPTIEALRQALAATPAPSQPLSDDQIDDLMPTNTSMPRSDALRWMARAVERAHGIKGEPS